MKNLNGKEASDYEVTVYLLTVSLANPLSHAWFNIYSQLFAKYHPEQAKDIGLNANPLNDYEAGVSRRLKRRLYSQRMKALKEGKKGEVIGDGPKLVTLHKAQTNRDGNKPKPQTPFISQTLTKKEEHPIEEILKVAAENLWIYDLLYEKPGRRRTEGAEGSSRRRALPGRAQPFAAINRRRPAGAASLFSRRPGGWENAKRPAPGTPGARG